MRWFSGYNFSDFCHGRKNRCISHDVWLFVIYYTKRNLKTSFIFLIHLGWISYDLNMAEKNADACFRVLNTQLWMPCWCEGSTYLSTLSETWLHHHCFYLLGWGKLILILGAEEVLLYHLQGVGVSLFLCLCFHY